MNDDKREPEYGVRPGLGGVQWLYEVIDGRATRPRRQHADGVQRTLWEAS